MYMKLLLCIYRLETSYEIEEKELFRRISRKFNEINSFKKTRLCQSIIKWEKKVGYPVKPNAIFISPLYA